MLERRVRMTLMAALTISIAALTTVNVLPQGNGEAAVRDVLLRSASSFEKNDTAEVTKVWINDESLTVFENGHANYGWLDALAFERATPWSDRCAHVDAKALKHGPPARFCALRA